MNHPNVEYANERVAASVLGCSARTLQGWRLRNQGPPYRRWGGRTIRYKLAEILAWAEHSGQ
jgi:predicted DNA-binding transcriptional regulator AlpA